MKILARRKIRVLPESVSITNPDLLENSNLTFDELRELTIKVSHLSVDSEDSDVWHLGQSPGRQTASSHFGPAVQPSHSLLGERGGDKVLPPYSDPEALSKREKLTNLVCSDSSSVKSGTFQVRGSFPPLVVTDPVLSPGGSAPGPTRPETWWERSPEAISQEKGLCEQ